LLLLTYRVRARNTSADSENGIHDDTVAAGYGFRGGLVPGVTVYAYMTTPIVARYGMKWLERGSMTVRFFEPVYDGDQVVVRAEVPADELPVRASIRAECDGKTCATATAVIEDSTGMLGEGLPDQYPVVPLPRYDLRPEATFEAFVPGEPIGTFSEKLDLCDTSAVESIDEKLTFYRGVMAVAHPFTLLGLANKALMSNFRLGPWIHASSELVNRSVARDGEVISVRGRIRECFERRGHEFVVLDLLLVADQKRIVQRIRHTAIYKPRLEAL
jgi:acyl dehydratase